MTEFVFPAGPNEYSLPAWEKIFQAKAEGIFHKFDNEYAEGVYFGTSITRGAEVAVVHSFLKKRIRFVKLPYPDPNFFDVVICLSSEFKQIREDGTKILGENSPEGAIFSNEKLKSTFEFEANVDMLWVVIRFNQHIARSFVQEEGDDLSELLNSDSAFMAYKYISPEMKVILERIKHLQKETYPEVVLRLKSGELLTLFFTEFLNLSHSHKHREINPADMEKIIHVKDLLLADLKNRPTISMLSRDVGMSPTKLKYLFKEIYGTSIMRYFQDYRLNQARKMLASTHYRVSDVAYEIGYSNLSHFSEAFKNKFGLLPFRFLEQVRSQNKNL